MSGDGDALRGNDAFEGASSLLVLRRKQADDHAAQLDVIHGGFGIGTQKTSEAALQVIDGGHHEAPRGQVRGEKRRLIPVARRTVCKQDERKRPFGARRHVPVRVHLERRIDVFRERSEDRFEGVREVIANVIRVLL